MLPSAHSTSLFAVLWLLCLCACSLPMLISSTSSLPFPALPSAYSTTISISNNPTTYSYTEYYSASLAKLRVDGRYQPSDTIELIDLSASVAASASPSSLLFRTLDTPAYGYGSTQDWLTHAYRNLTQSYDSSRPCYTLNTTAASVSTLRNANPNMNNTYPMPTTQPTLVHLTTLFPTDNATYRGTARLRSTTVNMWRAEVSVSTATFTQTSVATWYWSVPALNGTGSGVSVPVQFTFKGSWYNATTAARCYTCMYEYDWDYTVDFMQFLTPQQQQQQPLLTPDLFTAPAPIALSTARCLVDTHAQRFARINAYAGSLASFVSPARFPGLPLSFSLLIVTPLRYPLDASPYVLRWYRDGVRHRDRIEYAPLFSTHPSWGSDRGETIAYTDSTDPSYGVYDVSGRTCSSESFSPAYNALQSLMSGTVPNYINASMPQGQSALSTMVNGINAYYYYINDLSAFQPALDLNVHYNRDAFFAIPNWQFSGRSNLSQPLVSIVDVGVYSDASGALYDFRLEHEVKAVDYSMPPPLLFDLDSHHCLYGANAMPSIVSEYTASVEQSFSLLGYTLSFDESYSFQSRQLALHGKWNSEYMVHLIDYTANTVTRMDTGLAVATCIVSPLTSAMESSVAFNPSTMIIALIRYGGVNWSNKQAQALLADRQLITNHWQATSMNLTRNPSSSSSLRFCDGTRNFCSAINDGSGALSPPSDAFLQLFALPAGLAAASDLTLTFTLDLYTSTTQVGVPVRVLIAGHVSSNVWFGSAGGADFTNTFDWSNVQLGVSSQAFLTSTYTTASSCQSTNATLLPNTPTQSTVSSAPTSLSLPSLPSMFSALIDAKSTAPRLPYLGSYRWSYGGADQLLVLPPTSPPANSSSGVQQQQPITRLYHYDTTWRNGGAAWTIDASTATRVKCTFAALSSANDNPLKQARGAGLDRLFSSDATSLAAQFSYMGRAIVRGITTDHFGTSAVTTTDSLGTQLFTQHLYFMASGWATPGLNTSTSTPPLLRVVYTGTFTPLGGAANTTQTFTDMFDFSQLHVGSTPALASALSSFVSYQCPAYPILASESNFPTLPAAYQATIAVTSNPNSYVYTEYYDSTLGMLRVDGRYQTMNSIEVYELRTRRTLLVAIDDRTADLPALGYADRVTRTTQPINLLPPLASLNTSSACSITTLTSAQLSSLYTAPTASAYFALQSNTGFIYRGRGRWVHSLYTDWWSTSTDNTAQQMHTEAHWYFTIPASLTDTLLPVRYRFIVSNTDPTIVSTPSETVVDFIQLVNGTLSPSLFLIEPARTAWRSGQFAACRNDTYNQRVDPNNVGLDDVVPPLLNTKDGFSLPSSFSALVMLQLNYPSSLDGFVLRWYRDALTQNERLDFAFALTNQPEFTTMRGTQVIIANTSDALFGSYLIDADRTCTTYLVTPPTADQPNPTHHALLSHMSGTLPSLFTTAFTPSSAPYNGTAPILGTINGISVSHYYQRIDVINPPARYTFTRQLYFARRGWNEPQRNSARRLVAVVDSGVAVDATTGASRSSNGDGSFSLTYEFLHVDANRPPPALFSSVFNSIEASCPVALTVDRSQPPSSSSSSSSSSLSTAAVAGIAIGCVLGVLLCLLLLGVCVWRRRHASDDGGKEEEGGAAGFRSPVASGYDPSSRSYVDQRHTHRHHMQQQPDRTELDHSHAASPPASPAFQAMQSPSARTAPPSSLPPPYHAPHHAQQPHPAPPALEMQPTPLRAVPATSSAAAASANHQPASASPPAFPSVHPPLPPPIPTSRPSFSRAPSLPAGAARPHAPPPPPPYTAPLHPLHAATHHEGEQHIDVY